MSTEKTSTSPTEILFHPPEYEGSLSVGTNISLAMGALSTRMAQEFRTRVHQPDGRLENNAEHAYMLSKVALGIQERLYPWLDRGKVAISAGGHDDVEAWVGDTPTDPVANHNSHNKKTLEEAGIKQLVKDFTELLPRYTEEIVAYEKQEELEYQFVRIVDKFMPLLVCVNNNGAVLREHYTYEDFQRNTLLKEKELLDQYPHWIELIEMRTELALHIGQKYIRDWVES